VHSSCGVLICEECMAKLDTSLLPEHHTLVKEHYKSMFALSRTSPSASTPARETKGPLPHEKKARKLGMPLSKVSLPTDEATTRAYPGLLGWPQREAEIVMLAGVTEFSEASCRAVETSQGATWNSNTKEVAGCVLPGGKTYVTSRCRAMFGLENLRLQGCWLPESLEIRVAEEFSDCSCSDFAGNTFKATCFTSVLCTVLMSLAAHLQPVAAAQAEFGDTDVDDEETHITLKVELFCDPVVATCAHATLHYAQCIMSIMTWTIQAEFEVHKFTEEPVLRTAQARNIVATLMGKRNVGHQHVAEAIGKVFGVRRLGLYCMPEQRDDCGQGQGN